MKKQSAKPFAFTLPGTSRIPNMREMTESVYGEQWFECDQCHIAYPASQLVYAFDKVMKRFRLLCTTGLNDAEYLSHPKYIPIEERSVVEPEQIDAKVYPRPRPQDTTEQGQATNIENEFGEEYWSRR